MLLAMHPRLHHEQNRTSSPDPSTSDAFQTMATALTPIPRQNPAALTQTQPTPSASDVRSYSAHRNSRQPEQSFPRERLSDKDDSSARNPILLSLLMSNRDDALPVSPRLKTAEAIVWFNNSLPRGMKPCLTDEQIIEIIERRINVLLREAKPSRVQKVSAQIRSPPCPSPRVSTPGAPRLTFRDWDDEETVADGGGFTPEQTTRNSVDPGSAGIIEAAAICSEKEGPSTVVLQTSGPFATVEELGKCRPFLSPRNNASLEEQKSALRNPHSFDQEHTLCPRTERLEPVTNISNVADSTKSRKTALTFSVPQTSENEAFLVGKNSRERVPQFTVNSENERMNLSEISKPIEDLSVKSLVSHGSGNVQYEKDFSQEAQIEVQKETDQRPKGAFELINEMLRNQMYDDISDPEEVDMTPRIISTANASRNMSVCRDLSICPGPIQPFVNAETVEEDRPPQAASSPLNDVRTSGQQVVCNHPYFEETDDGFKEGPCPKCSQGAYSPCQEDDTPVAQTCPSVLCNNDLNFGHSQYNIVMDPQCEEDDSWLVVPLEATEVKFENIEIVDDTESSNDENEYPSNPDQQDQPSLNRHSPPCLQKIKEFDTIDSFWAEMVGPSAKYDDSAKLDTLEVADPEPAAVHSTDTEDGYDTDDSTDYPLQVKPNYLTASIQVRAPSPLSESGSDSDDDEMLEQPSASPPSNDAFFPDLSTDEDEVSEEDEANDVDIAPALADGFRKKACKSKHLEDCEGNTLMMGMFDKCAISSNFEDEQNQDDNYKAVLKPQSNQRMSEQTLRNSSSVKRKYPTFDHIDEKEAKQKRPSLDAGTSLTRRLSEKPQSAVQMPGKAIATSGVSEYTANNQNVNKFATETQKQNPVKRQGYQPLTNHNLSSQRNATVTKSREHPDNPILHSDGVPDPASSVPGKKRQSHYKNPHTRTNQINSYSTINSTTAKRDLVKDWENDYVHPRKRRASNERDPIARTTFGKTVNGRDHNTKALVRPPRKRYKSTETPLMKKTISEAKTWTNHTRRLGATERNPDHKLPGPNKWKNQDSPNDLDLDWDKESPYFPRGLTEL